LYASARIGDMDAIAPHLDDDAAINLTTENGATPLHVACHKGHDTVAELLLKQNADVVNQATKDGWAPLHAACQNNHVKVANLLLRHGAKVDQEVERGQWKGATPLLVACYNGHVDAAQLLLAQKKVDVNQATKDGWTPLHVACHRGHDTVAELLLQGGAVFKSDSSSARLEEGEAVMVKRQGTYYPGNISQDHGKDSYDVTYADGERETRIKRRLIRKLPLSPLDIAMDRGHHAVVELLEKRIYPLHAAAETGNRTVLAGLLANGIKVDQAMEGGWTPLHIACRNGHTLMARLLLENQANKKLTAGNGMTPLLIACQEGHVDAVQLLLDRGAEVDRANNDDETPLFMASRNGHVGAAQLLLENGAEVDQADKDGATPLFAACENGSVDAARLLLEKGAAVDRANKYGKTPLFAACFNGHVNAVRLMLDKGAEVDLANKQGTPLEIAKRRRHDAVIKLLEERLYPLCVAAKTGNTKVIESLLNGGAEINQKTEKGKTSLWIACENGDVNAVRLLLRKGAKIDRTNDDHSTPLDAQLGPATPDIAGQICYTSSDNGPDRAQVWPYKKDAKSFTEPFPWELTNTDYIRRMLAQVGFSLQPLVEATIRAQGVVVVKEKDAVRKATAEKAFAANGFDVHAKGKPKGKIVFQSNQPKGEIGCDAYTLMKHIKHSLGNIENWHATKYAQLLQLDVDDLKFSLNLLMECRNQLAHMTLTSDTCWLDKKKVNSMFADALFVVASAGEYCACFEGFEQNYAAMNMVRLYDQWQKHTASKWRRLNARKLHVSNMPARVTKQKLLEHLNELMRAAEFCTADDTPVISCPEFKGQYA